MSIDYFDPSAWIKRHFEETGSKAVNELFRTVDRAACCRLGLIERTATVVRKCHRESIDDAVVATLLDNVRADFAAFVYVVVDETLILSATDLAVRFRLRTMDAIHLACALSLGTDTTLVSADKKLLTAAEKSGLATVNSC